MGAASAATPRKNKGVKNDIKKIPSTDYADFTENNLCNLWINDLLASATRQKREQRKIQRLFRCQQFKIDVVRRRTTSHVFDVLAHSFTITTHHHVGEHG